MEIENASSSLSIWDESEHKRSGFADDDVAEDDDGNGGAMDMRGRQRFVAGSS